jgi:hypothetical protein
MASSLITTLDPAPLQQFNCVIATCTGPWTPALRDTIKLMERGRSAGVETPEYVVRELNRQGVAFSLTTQTIN